MDLAHAAACRPRGVGAGRRMYRQYNSREEMYFMTWRSTNCRFTSQEHKSEHAACSQCLAPISWRPFCGPCASAFPPLPSFLKQSRQKKRFASRRRQKAPRREIDEQKQTRPAALRREAPANLLCASIFVYFCTRVLLSRSTCMCDLTEIYFNRIY